MSDTKSKILLAALSQSVSERDGAAANISFLLENECDIKKLQKQFKKLSQANLVIESIQLYYASNCVLPEQLNEKKEKNDDNNS